MLFFWRGIKGFLFETDLFWLAQTRFYPFFAFYDIIYRFVLRLGRRFGGGRGFFLFFPFWRFGRLCFLFAVELSHACKAEYVYADKTKDE